MSFRKDSESEGECHVIVEKEIKEPDRYQVLMLNDDYTSMDFVVSVLRTVFYKTHEDATAIMLSVHEKGFGLCGVYTLEIAESKVSRVHSMARAASFPLKCRLEKIC
ncbi:MAG: ATP-dependent Clp protease adapter ClpS [Desulfovibrio sp.]|nr:ATP-dependent Clp protease adapter ClpS [Desulfovibrio sp.]